MDRRRLHLLAEIEQRYHDFSDLDSRYHRLVNSASPNRFIDSFFDVFIELSTDNGMSWQPSTTGPAGMTLVKATNVPCTVTITCPPDMVVKTFNAAGAVVKALFGEIGSAGGHQAMAKAVVPLPAFRRKYGSASRKRIEEVVRRGFQEETACAATSPARR